MTQYLDGFPKQKSLCCILIRPTGQNDVYQQRKCVSKFVIITIHTASNEALITIHTASNEAVTIGKCCSGHVTHHSCVCMPTDIITAELIMTTATFSYSDSISLI